MQMEELTALKMRDELREYLKPFRGCSIYFSEKDDALFYCRLDKSLERAKIEKMIDGIGRIGYTTEWVDGKLWISPQNVYIVDCVHRILQNVRTEQRGFCSTHLMMHKPEAITERGRKLILKVLRLTKWVNSRRDENRKLNIISDFSEQKKQIKSFRQECAMLLRRRESSGFFESGVFFTELERTDLFWGNQT